MTVTIRPSRVTGTAAAPPSKSAGHRAIICASLAGGVSHVTNVQYSQDVEATIAAVRQLGARVTREEANLTIAGIGGGGFATITRPVNCRESGSTLRFLIPLFSLTAQKVSFSGAPSLLARPLDIYADLFAEQGLRFDQTAEKLLIQGQLRAGKITLPGGVSSQFISGLLFTAPLLEDRTVLTVRPPYESGSYVGMTIDMLRRFGITVKVQGRKDGTAIYTVGPQEYQPCDVRVEGDYSQAAFLAALGALNRDKNARVTVTGLEPRTNQGDQVIVDLLDRFGAEVAMDGDALTVGPGPLNGIDIDLADCPDLGPVLMVLASFAKGVTTIRNAGRLRLKECDRIAAMQQELGKMGAKIEVDGTTVIVTGAKLHAPQTALDSHNDHRVVMSLTVAALAADIEAEITGAQAVTKSWPEFFTVLRELGVQAEEKNG